LKCTALLIAESENAIVITPVLVGPVKTTSDHRSWGTVPVVAKM
jgi:hypothetical protein